MQSGARRAFAAKFADAVAGTRLAWSELAAEGFCLQHSRKATAASDVVHAATALLSEPGLHGACGDSEGHGAAAFWCVRPDGCIDCAQCNRSMQAACTCPGLRCVCASCAGMLCLGCFASQSSIIKHPGASSNQLAHDSAAREPSFHSLSHNTTSHYYCTQCHTTTSSHSLSHNTT